MKINMPKMLKTAQAKKDEKMLNSTRANATGNGIKKMRSKLCRHAKKLKKKIIITINATAKESTNTPNRSLNEEFCAV